MNTEKPAAVVAEDEVVQICQRLIRIDSQNYGDDSGPGEREAAELVMELLSDVGIDSTYIESAPRRGNVIARIPGRDPSRPALVLHGHLDVVPAIASDWSVPPLGGEIVDGLIWGRGAVDMKDMDAMILAVVRELARRGLRTERDVILGFFADEEAGGNFGAGYLVKHHRDLFEGATEAISEVGGFSVEIDGQRAYLLQSAEKSLAWLRLVADGAAGHGSGVHQDSAITTLAEALVRIGGHRWPMRLTPTMNGLLAGVAELVGTRFDPDDEAAVQELIDKLGPAKKFVGAAVRNTTNVTRLDAGYKDNVIPGSASAVVDARFLPGDEVAGMAALAQLAGERVRIDPIYADGSIEADFEAPLVTRMIEALQRHDPGAPVLPYMLSAGTDNKSLSRLGIAGYGFVPLQLPADLDFTGMFHGVDERVPVESLRFGVRVLRDLLLGL
ncbi:M20/M25/M40 family metallo-hydrolase [Rarobacter faecitabidus]|uniref:Acetylornithine deacetylase/succinyl-diaminopimelate desuccinylase-like protein n=1 Tax=Rarobacter faecitabidus TaxID=13243 RepID=A0A542ZW53_RARFA|nr:M20/M25/M40 family metallo-hydrolase [Rarobacter faecitabidus]TQL64529.1 acetylornithine deacetylase/succinyl-diaminopimelate desuccinylase-like protein [Rarobacter faecitabidus]